MKEKIKIFFSGFFLIITVTFFLTWVIQGNGIEPGGSGALEDGTEELVAVLAKEIPAEYEEETIKAQAVIVRTNSLVADQGKVGKQEELTTKEMMELWGEEKFAVYYEKLRQCVKATEGEIITWQGEAVYIPFHAVSAGYTRTALESFGQKNRSYLKAVRSVEDIESPDFLCVTYYEKEEFEELYRQAFQDAERAGKETEDSEVLQTGTEQITILSRDEGGYVTQISAGSAIVNGEDFRNALGLNSACFSMEESEGKIRVVTKGLGHGLGFSQYGANEKAKEGMTYKELLNYYITGIEITE